MHAPLNYDDEEHPKVDELKESSEDKSRHLEYMRGEEVIRSGIESAFSLAEVLRDEKRREIFRFWLERIWGLMCC
jgi:hypothetical protein